jgi:hypothetical protein
MPFFVQGPIYLAVLGCVQGPVYLAVLGWVQGPIYLAVLGCGQGPKSGFLGCVQGPIFLAVLLCPGPNLPGCPGLSRAQFTWLSWVVSTTGQWRKADDST